MTKDSQDSRISKLIIYLQNIYFLLILCFICSYTILGTQLSSGQLSSKMTYKVGQGGRAQYIWNLPSYGICHHLYTHYSKGNSILHFISLYSLCFTSSTPLICSRKTKNNAMSPLCGNLAQKRAWIRSPGKHIFDSILPLTHGYYQTK